MNLLFDPWIPVRCRSGTQRDIAPVQLTDPLDPPIALVSVRPDFDGALAQFLIGLLQSTLPPEHPQDWRPLLDRPPTESQFAEAWAEHRSAFELLPATGAAFMQDLDAAALAEAELRPIQTLLIEAPGANAIENNADLFNKRDRIEALSPECAAMALLTLQINAPSGGQGHRTSLRGGGPLTTLIWPRQDAQGNQTTLWQQLWFNVRSGEPLWPEEREQGWPWLAATRISRDEVKVRGGPDALHFFACPRRIRLHAEPANGRRCSLTGRTSETVVTGWRTLNYGVNYPSEDFRHPLSPYYRTKPDSPQWLPLHPREGGFSYRDFQQVATGSGLYELAPVVSAAANEPPRREALRELGAQAALWAFGYDMDNMKARAWHEAQFPVFAQVEPERRPQLADQANRWTLAASSARELLAKALREAWSPQAGGNTAAVDAQFWNDTEAGFYRGLEAGADHDGRTDAGQAALRALDGHWLQQLRHAVLDLFAQHAERGNRQLDGLERAAKAREKLLRQFNSVLSKALDRSSAPSTKQEAA